jgi:CRP-like cAMP-binding protein
MLSEDPASATVVLETPARMWCAPVARIRRYLEQNDDVRRAVDRSFARALRAKLARKGASAPAQPAPEPG